MIKIITNKDKVSLSPSNDNVNLTTPQIIAGSGTSDYRELENKPSINGVVLDGDKALADLGIQPIGDYATKEELESKQPVGDYATKNELADKQDKGDYATKEELATKQDKGDYALSSEIPTKLPSPFGLTLTGAVSATYDGSKAVTVNIPSGSGGGGGSGTDIPVMFSDTYCEDVNTYLTNGYIKTGNTTKNLPKVLDYKSVWGVLFFIAENAYRGTGTQMLFPIDGNYKGQVLVRSITNKVPGVWKVLVQAESKIKMDDYATKAYVDEQIAKLAK